MDLLHHGLQPFDSSGVTAPMATMPPMAPVTWLLLAAACRCRIKVMAQNSRQHKIEAFWIQILELPYGQ